jgi:hypothetical protein
LPEKQRTNTRYKLIYISNYRFVKGLLEIDSV